MAFPDPQMPKYLFVDSSLTSIGAILTQKYGDEVYRPIGFASKRLNLSQRKQTIYSLELYACYFGVKHFSKYLSQREVHLKSDCKSLMFLMTQQKLPPNQARQVLFLSTYRIIIDHIAGISNPSDFMSRIIANLTVEQPYNKEENCVPMFSVDMIKLFQEQDDEIKLIKENLQTEGKLIQKFCLADGIIFKRRDPLKTGSTDKIYVPLNLRTEILRAHHNNPLAGHLGIARTKLLIEERYYWRIMRNDVTQHIRACKLCNYRKLGNLKKHFKIEAMQRAQGPNQIITVDVCGPLKITTNQNRYFMNVHDNFTKGTKSYAIKDQSAPSIAGVLYKHILQNGCMDQLISDNFSTLRSETYQELCRMFNVTYLYGTFYAKKSTGSVERSIRKTWDILAILQKSCNDEWDNLLDAINCIQRATPSLSTGQAPFTLETGRIFRMPFQPLINNTAPICYNEEDFLLQTRNNLKQIYEAAAKINEKEAARFVNNRNKKAAFTKFEPGDLVFIYFPQLVRPTGLKDSLPYCGPYAIQTVKRDKTIYAMSLATQKVIKVHAERCRRYFGNKIQERCSEEQLSLASGASNIGMHTTNKASTCKTLSTGRNKHISPNSTSDDSDATQEDDARDPLMLMKSRNNKDTINESYERSGEKQKRRFEKEKTDAQTEASDADTPGVSEDDATSHELCSETSELQAIAPSEFNKTPAISRKATAYGLRDRKLIRKPKRYQTDYL
jgi:RNase H-like domain found in reverse transcriptase/Integrase zinc binding domain